MAFSEMGLPGLSPLSNSEAELGSFGPSVTFKQYIPPHVTAPEYTTTLEKTGS